MKQTLYWETFDSPLGKITVCCSSQGLRDLSLGSRQKLRGRRNGSHHLNVSPGVNGSPEVQWLRAHQNNKEKGARLARRAVAELNEYVAGRRKRFTVPLDLQGTPFQLKVWRALLRIPYGKTRSYQQIARAVGNSRASRAVGMANHCNPVAIIVPCHRVIASDGSLGGYAGGLKRKTQILRLERAGL
ncbi:MAG: methylated-DNA--[protein]-cysteine S-methyltransferase [Acidobacteria bacterium]|nr:methylated-DNA--[protein]-cysteine S-methyltransferase [Acidobacteriota bacterium]